MGPRSPKFTLKALELAEKDIVAACLDLLAVRGYKTYRLHSGGARYPDGQWFALNKPGTADYVALHGRYPGFLLETKRPGKDLAASQRQMALELLQGYNIPTVKAATARELVEWLDFHEGQKWPGK
jgi:hypothetical protein